MGPGGLARQKDVKYDGSDRRKHKCSAGHRRPTQTPKPGGAQAIGYSGTNSDTAGHGSQSGADPLILLPADLVGDTLGGGLGFAQVCQRQRISLELTERL